MNGQLGTQLQPLPLRQLSAGPHRQQPQRRGSWALLCAPPHAGHRLPSHYSAVARALICSCPATIVQALFCGCPCLDVEHLDILQRLVSLGMRLHLRGRIGKGRGRQAGQACVSGVSVATETPSSRWLPIVVAGCHSWDAQRHTDGAGSCSVAAVVWQAQARALSPSQWPARHPCPSPHAQTRCACRPALQQRQRM
jgi:hypothetical protein